MVSLPAALSAAFQRCWGQPGGGSVPSTSARRARGEQFGHRRLQRNLRHRRQADHAVNELARPQQCPQADLTAVARGLGQWAMTKLGWSGCRR